MSLSVVARTLTKETLPSGGLLSLISPTLTTARTTIGNQGTSTRTPDIAPCINNYSNSTNGTGRAILSASRNQPRATKLTSEGKKVVEITHLERHPYTTQSFSPLGGSPSNGEAYIVVVAEKLDDGRGNDARFDLKTVKAYTVRGSEGVCYGANVWHAPMCVVGETLDFSIFQFGNGVPADDCEMIQLEQPLQVVY